MSSEPQTTETADEADAREQAAADTVIAYRHLNRSACEQFGTLVEAYPTLFGPDFDLANAHPEEHKTFRRYHAAIDRVLALFGREPA